MQDSIFSFFSKETNKFYNLVSTKDFPCLEISGIRMHCVEKGVKASASAMVRQIFPLKGKVLDTCCGLGYTAIMIASHPNVEKVFTFEIDANVLEIAKQNPFSKGLFENKKIFLENKNVFDAIKKFPDNFFDRILHDPPRFALARELYGRPFYCELYRALKKGGILFHYTGSPGEKKGIDFQGNAIKRLKETGFAEMTRIPEGQGIKAVKE
ncbi:MAG: methyltransferase [Candidatus ainarchaeum sp.]|nr:methyltransferase [Candidatus ainarchaeum sp.]